QAPRTTQLERARRAPRAKYPRPTTAITIQSNLLSWKNQTRPPPIVRPAATWSQKPYGRDGPSSTAIAAIRKASPTAIVTIAVQSPPPEMRSVTKNQIE